MKQEKENIPMDYIIELMMSTKEDDLHYIYRGEFSQNISSHILSLAEKNIDKIGMPSKIKKRVFHIMVESIQNITRHQDAPADAPEETAIFAIQKQKNWYYITTGNIIEKDKIAALSNKLEKINSLEQTELTQFYREILSNGKLSAKGGAGLGLIEMARKSGNKLSYGFRDVNEENSYFYLHTHINTAGDTSDVSDREADVVKLDYLIKLHKFINDNNIILIYGSIFDQEGLLSLISILDNQMEEKVAFKKKIISLMVEMLQNIIHHGNVDREQIKGSQGIFYISREENKYYLTTVNYIENHRIGILQNKIDHINKLSKDELEKFYNQRLFDFQINSNKEAGLGLIEMHLKSKNPIIYNFDRLDDKHSLYKITLSLVKK